MNILFTPYTFDASAQEVVFTGYTPLSKAVIKLIINVEDGIIIYNFADSTKGGTIATDAGGDILTLEYDTTSMSDSDELMIIIDDLNSNIDTITTELISFNSGLSGLSDQFPTTLGQTNKAGSLSITIASDQDTLPVSLASVPSHNVTNAGTFLVQAALNAGTNNIGDVDVLTLPALVAGTAIIGKVGIDQTTPGTTNGVQVNAALPAGTNNIGDIDVLTVPADPFGVNADAASATGSISAKLRFIAGTGIPITGTVTVGSHAVTNAGTFVTQIDGAALTSLQLADNVVCVLGTDTYTEATSSGTIIAAVRRDADTTLVNTTNEFGPLQMDANGRLKVEAFSGETLPVSLTSTTITGSVAVTQSGTWDEVGINDSGNSITVDNGGTFVTQIDGAALTALQLIDDPIVVLGTATYTETSSKGCTMAAVRRDADTTLVDTTNEFAPLQLDARGCLKVEAFSGETLPVSLASVPSHAVTNAGTFVTQIDGAALTSLQLADNVIVVLGTDTYTEATSSGTVIGAVRRDADTTLVNTTNEFGPLQMDANGRLKVEVFSGEALPVTMTSTTITGSVAVTNTGTFVTQIDGAALTALQLIDNSAFTDNAGFTDNSSGVTAAGFIYDEVAGTALTENDVAAARINVNRALVNAIEDGSTRGRYATVSASNALKVDGSAVAQPITDNSSSITVDAPVGTPVFVTITPSTTGGWSTMMATSADGSTALTNSAQVIKASAGTFGGYYIYNPNSSATYVHIYNTAAASVTVGTTNPQNTYCIPATSGANLEITNGVAFSTAMSCSATTTGGGNSAPASALEANFWFK